MYAWWAIISSSFNWDVFILIKVDTSVRVAKQLTVKTEGSQNHHNGVNTYRYNVFPISMRQGALQCKLQLHDSKRT